MDWSIQAGPRCSTAWINSVLHSLLWMPRSHYTSHVPQYGACWYYSQNDWRVWWGADSSLCSNVALLMPLFNFLRLTLFQLAYYTVSQKKTSHLWLAITLTHMNGFWYFLAEMLPMKWAMRRRFTMPPQITCASALPGKMGKHKNHIFHSIGLCYTHSAPVCCLPERKNCHLWCVW